MLAFRWHPDRNPQDPCAAERFRDALEAYETLIDPLRRGQYDRSRGYGKPRAKTRHHTDGPKERKNYSYRDMMEDVFGFKSERVSDHGSGYDLRFDLQVKRSALAEGTYEQIDYKRAVYCRNCYGNGRRAPAGSCEKCRGDGEIEESCSVRIWVPAGSQHGARLRVRGAGDCRTPGVAPGDLVVLLHILEGR